MGRVLVSALLCAMATTFLFPDDARAQVRRSDYRNDGDYHEFVDDPLHSKGAASGGWVLRIPPRKPRVMLLRPRASFVSEMLKSVETM
jgi:hypothetical protein